MSLQVTFSLNTLKNREIKILKYFQTGWCIFLQKNEANGSKTMNLLNTQCSIGEILTILYYEIKALRIELYVWHSPSLGLPSSRATRN